MKRSAHKFSLLLLILSSFLSLGLVLPAGRGLWPVDWPQELEPLRSQSRSIEIATGIQEVIFEIPVPDRATFEKIWPALLKIRTPGSPVTLARIETAPASPLGNLLNNQKAVVRISTSIADLSHASVDPSSPVAKLQPRPRPTAGKTLLVGAPWPKSIVGPKGELPEYVVAVKNKDGVLEWMAADREADQKQGNSRGGYTRARIDLELIADGKAIDLTTLKLPEDAKIVDRRLQSPK